MVVVRNRKGQEADLVSVRYDRNTEHEDSKLRVRIGANINATEEWFDRDAMLVVPSVIDLAGGLKLAIVMEESIKGNQLRHETPKYTEWTKGHPNAVPQKIVGGYTNQQILLWSNDTERSKSYMKVSIECQDSQGNRVPMAGLEDFEVKFSIMTSALRAEKKKQKEQLGEYDYQFDVTHENRDITELSSLKFVETTSNGKKLKGLDIGADGLKTPTVSRQRFKASLETDGSADLLYRVMTVSRNVQGNLMSLR
jgi:hypothetical protein